MSEVAIVAPLEVHKRLAEAGELGNYQLLLAHEVLANPTAHSEFWRAQPNQLIIMDNSLIEMGYPLPIDVVAEAAELVDAQVLVLPDVLGDRAKTFRLFMGAMDQANLMKLPYKLLGVAQGTSSEETFFCGKDMVKAGADMLSVPRNLVKLSGSRFEATVLLGRFNVPLHLLGFSNDLYDDFACVTLPNVGGIDSALPIWYPYILPETPPVNADFGSRPSDFSTLTNLPPFVLDNVRRVRQWAHIAPTVPTKR